ncbi:glycosyltransferase family 4 protein [Turicibacter bilis]|uniref:glycosyltransferase family 4 protein n=1 Tax=Turicibacter bilis TaxID=2735723 RepID=UPI0031BB6166
MKKKMKIAMLGHKRIPSREGGVEIVVEELAVRMVNEGHEVTCYNRSGNHVSGEKIDSYTDKTYKAVQLKNVWTLDKRGLAAMTASLTASIRVAFGQYDVIHYHAEGPCAMMWIPKLFKKRCVATIHGLDWQREKWKNGFGSKYIKFGEKVAVKFADEIIVLSKSVQEYFKETYNRETILIPNGVHKPKVLDSNKITEKYELESNSYILFLARIVPEKGLHYLIEAFNQVQTNKKLVIAGGASDTDSFMDEIKEMARNDERIIFTGFVQGQILQELYSNAYIYILPSDLEGMPLSLLEAMSYGNCCIVSSILECTDVVEDKAVIFQKGSVNDLREKIQYLCDNEDMVKKYKDGATDFICEKYNWDEVTDMTLQLYEKLI